jgi:long-chain fatty acid transport protein
MKGKIFLNLKNVLILWVAFIMTCSFVATASATNGYFSHGYSVKNKALAGAGTALPLDSLAASTNPAGMAFVGKRVDVGITLFNPNREYTVTGDPTPPPPGCELTGTCPFGLTPGTEKSGSRWFVIPSFGVNWMMDSNNALGLSVFGNGGMNTDYDTGTFNYVNPALPQETGVDLMQLFIAPTYARKITPKHALGISPILAYQAFEAKGLDIFGMMGFSSNADKLTDNGHDSSYGYGARIGYLGEILPNLYIGASYQTEIKMSRFKKYEGLFAEEGDFDIPQNWSVGLAYSPVTELTFAFDVQKIYYSDIKSINNPLLPNLQTSLLGNDNGAGFGWEDMTVYKIGVQWLSSPEWTWRAGYSIGDQPIPSSEVLFNIIAPGVIEQHITAGFTKTMGSNQELSVTLMHALSNDERGKNPLDPAQTIELKMNQWEISAGYSWKF